MRPIVDIKSEIFNISEEVLGAGAFSVVKLANTKDNNTPVALKICHCNCDSEWLQSLNEICLVKKFSHSNIVHLIDYEITRFHVLTGLDKGESTLKEYILTKDSKTRRANVALIMGQLIRGLNYINGYKIIHSDIKPSNIIYVTRGDKIHIQIMDFGLSHVAPKMDCPSLKAMGGTLVYLAPERLFHLAYDESSDLFSAGIVFFEILFRHHPFYKEGESHEDFMRTKPHPRYPQGYEKKIPEALLEILCSMLSFNPRNRNVVRNNTLLNTTYVDFSKDHHLKAVQNVARGEDAERSGQYTEAAIHFMDASINFAIAAHEHEMTKNVLSDMTTRILTYRKKALDLIHHFKHSYAAFKSSGGKSIFDEYYEYLMEVTASTPRLKHYIEMGYNGEFYLIENKEELAYSNFIGALQYLHEIIRKEPPGERKTLIGRKVIYNKGFTGTRRKDELCVSLPRFLHYEVVFIETLSTRWRFGFDNTSK